MTSRFWLFATLGVLSACSFQGQNPQSAGEKNPAAAGFDLTQISVETVEPAGSVAHWGWPSLRQYHLKTCLIDRGTGVRLARAVTLTLDHPSENGTPISKTTDPEGCLHWNEAVSFAYLKDEGFSLKQVRFAMGQDAMTVPLAINPHSLGSDAVADLRFTQRTLQEAGTTRSTQNLRVTKVHGGVVKVTENKLTLEPTFEIKAQRRGLNNPEILETVLGSDFRIDGEVLEMVGANAAVLYRGQGKIIGNLNGVLVAQFELDLNKALETQSQLQLRFTLTPEGSDSGLSSYSGSVITQVGARSFDSAPESWNQEPLRSVDPPAVPLPALPPQHATGFQIGNSLISRGQERPLAKDCTITTFATATVCFQHAFPFGEPIVNKAFQLSVHSEASDALKVEVLEGARTTDIKGCAHFPLKLQYPWADTERFIGVTLTTTSRSTVYPGVQREIQVHINPWQEGEGFFWNTAMQGAVQFEPAKKPSIYIDGKRLDTTAAKRTFWLDKNLQLVSLRRLLLDFGGQLHREGSYKNPHRFENLKPGFPVKLTGLLRPLSNSRDQEKIGTLSAFEYSTKVERDGKVRADVVFPTRFIDSNLVEGATELEVVVTPLCPTHNPEASSWKGDIVLSRTRMQGDLRPTRLTESQSRPEIAQALPNAFTHSFTNGTGFAPELPVKGRPIRLLYDHFEKLGPIRYLETDSKLSGWHQLLAPYNSAKWDAPRSLEWVRLASDVFDGKRPLNELNSMLQPLCGGSALNLPKNATEETVAKAKKLASDLTAVCKKTPTMFYQFSQFTIIEELRSQPRIVDAKFPSIQLSATFFSEDKLSSIKRAGTTDQSTLTYFGWTAKLGLEQFGSGASIQTGFSRDNVRYTTNETAYSRDDRDGLRQGTSYFLDGFMEELEFDAEFRRCALIRPLPTTQAVWTGPALYFCGPLVTANQKNTEITPVKTPPLREKWYEIRDGRANVESSHTDNSVPEERGWFKVLRGEEHYYALESLFKDGTRNFELKRIGSTLPHLEANLKALQEWDARANQARLDGGTFSGLLRYAENSGLKWTQVELDTYVHQCVAQFDEQRSKAPKNRIARYCQCDAASMARYWTHEEFLQVKKASEDRKENWKFWKSELSQVRTVSRQLCEKFAKGEEAGDFK